MSIHILYMLLLLHVNHFTVILMFYMDIKFGVFFLQSRKTRK